jgi:hypothetical protein
MAMSTKQTKAAAVAVAAAVDAVVRDTFWILR